MFCPIQNLSTLASSSSLILNSRSTVSFSRISAMNDHKATIVLGLQMSYGHMIPYNFFFSSFWNDPLQQGNISQMLHQIIPVLVYNGS